MVETVRIQLGEARHAPVVEIARVDDFKKAQILKKLDTFVAREANELELKKTEAERDRLGLANRLDTQFYPFSRLRPLMELLWL